MTEKAPILGLFLGFRIGLKIFLPLKRNREFRFEPKIQYARAAEQSEAASSDLQFPFWCPRQELNLHLFLRREVSYPLNDEGDKRSIKYRRLSIKEGFELPISTVVDIGNTNVRVA